MIYDTIIIGGSVSGLAAGYYIIQKKHRALVVERGKHIFERNRQNAFDVVNGEGGAGLYSDGKTKKRIDYLKNFGFAGETEVVAPGINSKMDEMRAAYGLLNLKQVDEAIEARHQVAVRYREALKDVEGIEFWDDIPGVRHNYSYFPIFVHESYGMPRDELYFKMRDKGVLGRRYFYPLISDFSTYRGLESAALENLPVATKMAERVICLPMHHAHKEQDIERVVNCIKK